MEALIMHYLVITTVNPDLYQVLQEPEVDEYQSLVIHTKSEIIVYPDGMWLDYLRVDIQI